MRRFVPVPPRTAPVVLAPIACPFVHAAKGVRAHCTQCRRPFSAIEAKEFAEACNGAASCDLGRHVPRLCERCAYAARDAEAPL